LAVSPQVDEIKNSTRTVLNELISRKKVHSAVLAKYYATNEPHVNINSNYVYIFNNNLIRL